jgi:uncharacterized protein (TIGR03083 family)
MLEEPAAVITAPLFPEILTELLSLLKSLSADDWQKPTACSNWSVKDVALHLLGGEIGNLSRRRDGTVAKAVINSRSELVSFINNWNQEWVSVSGRMSTGLLVDLLEFVGPQMCAYFQTLEPFAMGAAVSWAGPEPAPVWLDLAREYTERWHHQQHIRDAVGKPGLKEPHYFSAVLAAFMRALPETFRETHAAENTCVTVTISGPSGGRWSILRKDMFWKLYDGAPAEPNTEFMINQEHAWRLFTRGLSPDLARQQISINGEQALGLKVLDMVSIIA